MSNADLYTITPPAYMQSVADGEVMVDAEATRDEKIISPNPSRNSVSSFEHETLVPTSPRPTSVHSSQRPSTPLHVLQQRAREHTAFVAPTGPTPQLMHYLTEPTVTAALVGARACSILHDRPAIWLVKGKKMALSPLAAAVLSKEGLIGAKDLELMSQHPSTRRDPTDPLSGLLLGIYDTIGEISLGLVAGPVELGRQATPMLTRFEDSQRTHRDDITQPVTAGKLKRAPHPAARVVVESGKGLGRILTASLKTPVLTMNGMTRGFHNLPKAWGEEVREYENVTGFRSGCVVSAKSFGYGLSDGLLDMIAKPAQGAQKNGMVGFAIGIGKGLGNAVCKPVAGTCIFLGSPTFSDQRVIGACGLVGYTSVGVYESIRRIKIPHGEVCPVDLVRKLGEAEYEAATDADKLYVVRVWCQTMMRVRLV
ncbi:hypothetical protein EK21DRAFT_102830 [Setomelanomma holmii]|uniref:Uncharacterized protein n=1 Tax=Setomelanomma holmii TaxID=210430 RepID=A0A9P4H4R5_9PLEO|nr:hypothetical protein EK21DRAFT_102830 [Setomelanomma holmii]